MLINRLNGPGVFCLVRINSRRLGSPSTGRARASYPIVVHYGKTRRVEDQAGIKPLPVRVVIKFAVVEHHLPIALGLAMGSIWLIGFPKAIFG